MAYIYKNCIYKNFLSYVTCSISGVSIKSSVDRRQHELIQREKVEVDFVLTCIYFYSFAIMT